VSAVSLPEFAVNNYPRKTALFIIVYAMVTYPAADEIFDIPMIVRKNSVTLQTTKWEIFDNFF
jgi:hypothetical protein